MAKRKRKGSAKKVRPQRLLGANDGPPIERLQHDQVVIEGTGQPHYRITTQTALDRYKVRGELDPLDAANNVRLWVAGDRLRQDLALSSSMPGVLSQLKPKITAGAAGPADPEHMMTGATHAAAAVRGARAAVGLTMWPLVLHVCGDYGAAADFAGKFRGKSGALTALSLGLDALARFYRIGRREQDARKIK